MIEQPTFKKFEIVTVDWGYNTKCLNKQMYSRTELLRMKSINFGVEFSDININCRANRHMGIVVSSFYFNKYSKSVLVAPITSIRPDDKETHMNKFILRKSDYHKLRNDSVVLLDKIREIDKKELENTSFF